LITKELIHAIKEQYELNWYGVHGIHHWGRVYSNGLRLSEVTGANMAVVELFSVFHDSRRLNEGKDKDHGARGANLAEKLRHDLFNLSDDEFGLLQIACSLHTISRAHSDITVQTCFDADRLDLARVGKTTNPEYLCTPAAKRPDILNWANERSFWGYVPDIVSVWE
jgi:uncharacterized protein